MKKIKEFKPLWNFIKEDRSKFIFAIILIIISDLISTLGGYLIGKVTDYIANYDYYLSIMYLVIYIICELIGDAGLYIYAESLLQIIESKVSRKLGYFTYKKSLNLPAYAYEEKSSGEIINRIVNDADSLSFAFGRLVALFSSILGSTIVITYIFYNSWIIGLEIILFVCLLYIVIKKYDPLLIDAHKERKKCQDKYTSLVNESVRGIREIKTLGIKKRLIDDMKDIVTSIFKKSKNEIDLSRKYTSLTQLLKVSLEGVTFLLCLILIIKHKISLAFFVSMTYYVYRFTGLIDNINNFSQTYQKLIVSLERVNEILENRLYNDIKFGNKKLENIKGEVQFNNVNFAYPNEKQLLNDFSIKIEPNKKIAIVGASGQGKSTLFNLITRIFDPISGTISIDGINICDLSEEELRKHVSIIRQEPFIFNRSILDNFKLIDNNITLKEVRKYTKMAYLDDYIMSLPNKYDTILGEGGVNLSGGQKQRLSIARTLIKDSKIILFDEATSSLDNGSQEYIKKTIDNLVKDHTIIVIAHRLSTIMDSDIIYLVNEGRVIDSGKHNELLKTSDIYRNLYETESLNSKN